MAPQPTPWPFRFWTKVQPVASGCWEWQGARDRDGYGFFSLTPTKLVRAHRFAFARFIGRIPSRRLVMHSCDNPRCVRLEHLSVGTCALNSADMKAKGRNRNGNSGRTHCRRGHLLAGDNLILQPTGRRCRACRRVSTRAATRAYRQRQVIRPTFLTGVVS